MKAIILFYFYAAVLAVMGPVKANAAPGAGCSQIVQNLNDVVALIDQDASSYWAHRANYVDLIFGPSSRVVPNARQVAEGEKSQGDAVKAGIPNRAASLKGLLTAAQAQNCLSPAQQSAITEPRFKDTKRVNFDQFPPEESSQSTTDRGPRRMP
jgi:hypothetical protein